MAELNLSRLGAQVGTASSRVLARIPFMADRILGNGPNVHRVDYRVMTTRYEKENVLLGGWAGFEGDPSAGRIPSHYSRVGTLVANHLLFNVAAHKDRLTPAVAWIYGSTILAAVIPEELYPSKPDESLIIGMRVGRNALTAALGFMDASFPAFATGDGLYSQGEVYDGSVPDNIPIL